MFSLATWLSMQSQLNGQNIHQSTHPDDMDMTFMKTWSFNGNFELALGVANDQFLLAGSNPSIRPNEENSIRFGYMPLVRCNQDGSLDPYFELFKGNDRAPNLNALRLKSLVNDSRGRVLLGGIFTISDFEERSESKIVNLSRFYPDGTLDVSFNSGLGADGEVNVIAPLLDGDIWIGGRFSNYHGRAMSGISLIDDAGQIVETFKLGAGFDQHVQMGFADEKGRLVVIGVFDFYNEQPVNGMARINQDGSLDLTFTANGTFDQKPTVIIESPDKTMFVAGDFKTFQNALVPPLIKLSEQGELIEAFQIPNQLKIVEIKTMVMGEGNDYLYVEASLTNEEGATELRLLRLNSMTGALDEGFLSNMQPF